MLALGQFNVLNANRKTDQGIYLMDEEDHEVLLPNKYIPENLQIKDEINVFIYKDSEDRITATTQTPLIELNKFAFLQAKDKNRFGVFFDWGLDKDLLVPYSQQENSINPGEKCMVYLYLDEVTNRLAGSTKVNSLLKKVIPDLSVGDLVEIIPYTETEIGYHTIVNHLYQGMIYNNEIFSTIHIGETLEAYVKKIRNDHKIDLSLQKFGYKKVDDSLKHLLDCLIENHGILNLNDKSSPDEIQQQLGMSKKVFKKAIGALYKQHRIKFTDHGIQLIK